MKNNMMVKLGAVLCVISAVAAGILAFTNEATKEKIAVAEELASSGPEVAQAVIPNSVSFELLEDTALLDKIKTENADFIEIRVCKDANGQVLGYGIRTLSPTPGYAGKIEMFVGISNDGKIAGMKILAMKETAGLGTKIAEPKFQTQFLNRDAGTEIKLSKSSPKENEIQALTGATRSSRSFTSGVNNAMIIYNQFLKK